MPATLHIPSKPKRKNRDVTGVLRPEDLLTIEGCLKVAGIGHETLHEARDSGIVKPIPCGKRLYYSGAELIEFIKSQRN